MRPPCPKTASLQKASPIPNPPALLVPRRRVNLSKMRSCSPGGSPVHYLYHMWTIRLLPARTSRTPVTAVNLLAFSAKLIRTRRAISSSPDDGRFRQMAQQFLTPSSATGVTSRRALFISSSVSTPLSAMVGGLQSIHIEQGTDQALDAVCGASQFQDGKNRFLIVIVTIP